MTRDQRIAAVLGGATGVLVIALLVLKLGVGTGYRVLELEDGAEEAQSIAGMLREPPKLGAFEQYADITARPVFNESRTPEIPDKPPVTPEGDPGEMDAALTGVIVTDQVKIAFVRDNKTNEVQRVKLGQPMEGEQSGWTLVTVEPRKVVFEGGGKQAELELSVDEKGAPPPTPVLPAGPASMPPVQPVGEQPGTQPPQPVAQAQGQPANADEIRKRIEERRRQLREEAQRMMQEQQQKQ